MYNHRKANTLHGTHNALLQAMKPTCMHDIVSCIAPIQELDLHFQWNGSMPLLYHTVCRNKTTIIQFYKAAHLHQIP